MVADDAMTLGFLHFRKYRIGAKKIPPPIPTTPEIKPRIAPISKLSGIDSFLVDSISLLLKRRSFKADKKRQPPKKSKKCTFDILTCAPK